MVAEIGIQEGTVVGKMGGSRGETPMGGNASSKMHKNP